MLHADPSSFPSVFTEPVDAPAANGDGGFGVLGLPRKLVRALAAEGITKPFPIQTATVPDALSGRDVLGRGQTGSGKTLAFGLPLLTRVSISGRAKPHAPKVLVLVPTRELAMQVNDALTPLARALGLFCKTAVGGVPYDRQIWALERGIDVLVATPGRLGDLVNRGACRLDAVEITVLDEADQMADMGFLPEVTELLAKTPKGGQRLLFSATLDKDVDALVARFLSNPVTHSIEPATASIESMDHHVLLVPPHDKFAVAASIAARTGRTMLFVKTQAAVDELVTQFAAVGVRAGALHGGKTQRVRTRTLAEFREGSVDVLVATDVAARGIHIDDVSLVVHVDLPRDQKDYVHRAGRTARAGAAGTVVTLVLPRQRKRAADLLAKAGVKPTELRVRAGDAALTEVTGARQPSGVPVRVHLGESVHKRAYHVDERRPARRPRHQGEAKSGGDTRRPPGDTRRPPRHRHA